MNMRHRFVGIQAHKSNDNQDDSSKANKQEQLERPDNVVLAFLTALYPPFPLPLGLTIRIQFCVMLIRQSWCVLPSAPGQRFH